MKRESANIIGFGKQRTRVRRRAIRDARLFYYCIYCCVRQNKYVLMTRFCVTGRHPPRDAPIMRVVTAANTIFGTMSVINMQGAQSSCKRKQERFQLTLRSRHFCRNSFTYFAAGWRGNPSNKL